MLARRWIAAVTICCQSRGPDERGVRELISRWNAAYRSLDAKTLSALQTPDFEIVNRLGQWTPTSSSAQNEQMWAWAFTNIYKGKPGPDHKIERVRFVPQTWP
ncbi:MAG TPA: hypothetical protein VJQ50_16995 [Terriglobales bacterium]|jgi:hypothetical protein|nr:hypothetical protein [Terriglobales bacterium]